MDKMPYLPYPGIQNILAFYLIKKMLTLEAVDHVLQNLLIKRQELWNQKQWDVTSGNSQHIAYLRVIVEVMQKEDLDPLQVYWLLNRFPPELYNMCLNFHQATTRPNNNSSCN